LDGRIILHFDMDAFFASCEELRHPEAKGRPLVVGAGPKDGEGRGVVVAANYAARAFGIRSAMPIREAWRRCPDAHFVRPDHSFYVDISRRIFNDLRAGFAIEQTSIDESFLDITDLTTWEAAEASAPAVGSRAASGSRRTSSWRRSPATITSPTARPSCAPRTCNPSSIRCPLARSRASGPRPPSA
jgi:nucleotidyltransferase/DNA polymerase involved in DNA repair